VQAAWGGGGASEARCRRHGARVQQCQQCDLRAVARRVSSSAVRILAACKPRVMAEAGHLVNSESYSAALSPIPTLGGRQAPSTGPCPSQCPASTGLCASPCPASTGLCASPCPASTGLCASPCPASRAPRPSPRPVPCPFPATLRPCTHRHPESCNCTRSCSLVRMRYSSCVKRQGSCDQADSKHKPWKS